MFLGEFFNSFHHSIVVFTFKTDAQIGRFSSTLINDLLMTLCHLCIILFPLFEFPAYFQSTCKHFIEMKALKINDY